MQSLFPVTEDRTKYLAGNVLVCADNVDVLKVLPNSSIDLIYLDPPFNSDTHYVAIFGDKGKVDEQLKDIWKWTTETERTFQRLPFGPVLDALKGIRLQAGPTSPMAAYCVFMARRLMEMHRALKETGSIYLHCDWRASHYLRVVLDAVFGSDNFRNEIVWFYGGRGAKAIANQFPRNHDVLLFYTKEPRSRIFERQYVERPFTVDEARRPGFRQDEEDRWFKTAPRGDYTDDSVRRLESEGRIYRTRTGSVRVKYFLKESEGKVLEDVLVGDTWSDIADAMHIGKERVGYPTQKPLKLLERIIKASSNPGGLVLDPFCGCGTAADAAAKLGRKYLGIDISGIAVRVMEQRLRTRGESVSPVVYGLEWSDYDWEQFERRALLGRDDAEDGTPGWAWAEDKVAGLLNAIPNSKKTGDGGVDARYYGAAEEVIPIQAKMHRSRPVGRPDMDKLLGAQTAMQNRGIHAPMSLMVSLYPPPHNLRTFAVEQGRVPLNGDDYPVMQALSVEEMLTKGERPKLPPVDPRFLVGSTQTRMMTEG